MIQVISNKTETLDEFIERVSSEYIEENGVRIHCAPPQRVSVDTIYNQMMEN